MPRMWSPGVRCACARNIEPNLPAPMRPTRTGLPASARARSFAARFTLLLRGGALRVGNEAVVGQHLDRGEVPIGDPGRALEAANRVVAAIQGEINDPARPRRQVRARGVDEIAVEEQHRARRTLGRDDAALLDETGDGGVVDRPERVARGGDVVPGLETAAAVAPRDE